MAKIYGWFTEGFDTPDLQEAKALLEELKEKKSMNVENKKSHHAKLKRKQGENDHET